MLMSSRLHEDRERIQPSPLEQISMRQDKVLSGLKICSPERTCRYRIAACQTSGVVLKHSCPSIGRLISSESPPSMNGLDPGIPNRRLWLAESGADLFADSSVFFLRSRAHRSTLFF